MADPKQILAAINPKLYNKAPENSSDLEKLKKIKELTKVGKFVEATKFVSPQALTYSGDFNAGYTLDLEGFSLDKRGVEASYKLTYETYAESLEPIYYYLLDFMNDLGLRPRKIIDNFASAPGSSHFSEMGQKKTIMQQQATTLLGNINTVIRSILNLVYDLKQFRMRLETYDHLREKEHKSEALLSLKQIWMDKVDITRGTTSIKGLATGQSAFITLIDAFLVVDTQNDVDRIDLNDRVKRVLKERLAEFEIWLVESERELRKRYEIEKTYLKSQVSSLQLYTRWVKPYLNYANELEQGDLKNPGITKAFNRVVLQLSLFGTRKVDPVEAGKSGILPEFFTDSKLINRLKSRGELRDYNIAILVEFIFRAVPQSGAFIGRADVEFSAYVLNNEELEAFNKALEQDDLDAGLSLVQGVTDESLGQLKEDIDFFLNDDSKEEKKPSKEKDSSDVNPFLALFGYYDREEKKEEKKPSKKEFKEIKGDSYYEEFVRGLGASDAVGTLFTLFDVYKKAHGMGSYA